MRIPSSAPRTGTTTEKTSCVSTTPCIMTTCQPLIRARGSHRFRIEVRTDGHTQSITNRVVQPEGVTLEFVDVPRSVDV